MTVLSRDDSDFDFAQFRVYAVVLARGFRTGKSRLRRDCGLASGRRDVTSRHVNLRSKRGGSVVADRYAQDNPIISDARLQGACSAGDGPAFTTCTFVSTAEAFVPAFSTCSTRLRERHTGQSWRLRGDSLKFAVLLHGYDMRRVSRGPRTAAVLLRPSPHRRGRLIPFAGRRGPRGIRWHRFLRRCGDACEVGGLQFRSFMRDDPPRSAEDDLADGIPYHRRCKRLDLAVKQLSRGKQTSLRQGLHDVKRRIDGVTRTSYVVHTTWYVIAGRRLYEPNCRLFATVWPGGLALYLLRMRGSNPGR